MNLDLEGKKAIVTGGSKGIGLATAKRLAAEGVEVVLIARTEQTLEAAAQGIRDSFPVDVAQIVADLTDGVQLQAAMEKGIRTMGGVDILINNAGASPFGGFDGITDDQWQQAFELKLLGYARCMRAVLGSMRKQRYGVIINVVGMAGRMASPSYTLGCLNAALLHLTKSTSELVGPEGIRVMAVNPGLTETDRMEEALRAWAQHADQTEQEFRKAYLLEKVPLRRFTKPDEVASAIVCLCSDVFAPATGSAVQLDGGAAKGVF